MSGRDPLNALKLLSTSLKKKVPFKVQMLIFYNCYEVVRLSLFIDFLHDFTSFVIAINHVMVISLFSDTIWPHSLSPNCRTDIMASAETETVS